MPKNVGLLIVVKFWGWSHALPLFLYCRLIEQTVIRSTYKPGMYYPMIPKTAKGNDCGRITAANVFSVQSLTWESRNKNGNHRKSRIWEMKEGKYTKKPCQESGLCSSSYARYSEKRFTQIYKALYGDAMFVSLSGHKYWLRETNTNICFWVSGLLMREFFTWGTHKD